MTELNNLFAKIDDRRRVSYLIVISILHILFRLKYKKVSIYVD